MAAVAGMKYIGEAFSNDVEYTRVIWDFAVDGGASGAQIDLFTAQTDCLVTSFHAVVKTTCVSAASGTMDIGITGTENYFSNALAVSTLSANTVIRPVLTEGTPNVAKLPVRLASGNTISYKLETSTFEAGKIEFVVGVMKA